MILQSLSVCWLEGLILVSSEVDSSSSLFMMYSVNGLIALTAPGILGAGESIGAVVG